MDHSFTKATHVNIQFKAARQVNDTQWEVLFEIATPGCDGSTGSFDYDLVIRQKDGSFSEIKRSSSAWTTSSGGVFTQIEIETLNVNSTVYLVKNINSIKFHCYYGAASDLRSSVSTIPGCTKITASYAQFIALMFELAYVYNTINSSGGDITKILVGVEKQFKDLEKLFSDTLSKLDEIADLLKKLPKIIQDTIDKSFLNDALSSGSSATLLLADLTKPALIEQNVQKIDFQLNELHKQIKRILDDGKSFHRIYAAAPFMTVWLNGNIALQKVEKKLNTNHQIFSPWDSGLMRDFQSTINTMYLKVDESSKNYSKNLIPNIPMINKPLLIGNPFFHVINRPTIPGIPPIQLPDYRLGDFMIYCDSNSNEKILYARERRASDVIHLPNGIDIPDTPIISINGSERIGFWPLKAPFLNYEEIVAIEKYERLQLEKNEFRTFVSVFDELSLRRQEIFSFFSEPNTVWS